jgi:hypothetical protein
MDRNRVPIHPPQDPHLPLGVPALPVFEEEEEVIESEEAPTGPGRSGAAFVLDSFPPIPVSVTEEPEISAKDKLSELFEDVEEEEPIRTSGIPDWAPISAMVLCIVVGFAAVFDRIF